MMKHVVTMMFVLLVAMPVLAQSWLGGDISMMTSNARQGVIYKDSCGVTVDPYDLFKQQGWNMMRVRLFVDPQNAPGRHHDEGVCQDLNYVIDLCRTIRSRGFEVMLDFHYSDTWADPAKQFTPKRWDGIGAKVLADSIYRYTRHCLEALKAAGVEPATIQVGNEITFGMDWPVGRVDPMSDGNWDVFTQLLKSGCKACREVCPTAGIIIHTEKAGVWEMTGNYYDRLKQANVDYDIIGLSYYPYFHGNLSTLAAGLNNLSNSFQDKDIMIVETGYSYHYKVGDQDFSSTWPLTLEGQRQFTADLIAKLKPYSRLKGLFWWFPEANEYGLGGSYWNQLHVNDNWYNAGLWNHETGRATPALYELKNFVE